MITSRARARLGDPTRQGDPGVTAIRRQRPWQFTPIRHFLSRSDMWMYRSLVWSVIIAAIMYLSLGALIVLIAASQEQNWYLPFTWLAVAGLSVAVISRWALQGVDLRDTRPRIEVTLIMLAFVSQISVVHLTGGPDAKVALFVSAAGALLTVTIMGPAWVGWVYVAATAVFVLDTALPTQMRIIAIVFVAVYWFSIKLTLWYVNVMRDLTEARHMERRLAVSEERLRFADDLHDVVGRSLSIISVQAELADQLAARHDDQAREHLHQIRTEAAKAASQMRSLVRGYREPTLATELRGARQLLESAGMTVHVTGQDAWINPRYTAMAGYFVREAATNILRHSHAENVDIAVTAAGIRITNDRPVLPRADDDADTPRDDDGAGVPGPDDGLPGGSGIETLRRKLVESGLGERHDVQVTATPQEFTIEIRFAAPQSGPRTRPGAVPEAPPEGEGER
ncbi:MAG: histidine kinase [Bowdeniella nasicola]|nr:histidine kinase [Bowdeniella nasicola]